MRNKVYMCGIAVFAVVALLVFANCVPSPGVYIPGKATGGGQLIKMGEGRATFGFNGSSCKDPDSPTGRFNYNDKSASIVASYGKQGVMVNGTVTSIAQCITSGGCTDPNDPANICPEGGYLVGFEYESNNKNFPGTGSGQACIVDAGEGKAAPDDQAGIHLDSGPFSGYAASGFVVGNVQGHLCSGDEEE